MEESKEKNIMDVRSVVEAIATDANDSPLYQVESLCMRCGQNGITRLLLTLIPNFRKILLSAFECPHCGERNNEAQFAGELQPRGSCYRLKFSSGDQKMLNRQVVKSESATIKKQQEIEKNQKEMLEKMERMHRLLEVHGLVPSSPRPDTNGSGSSARINLSNSPTGDLI